MSLERSQHGYRITCDGRQISQSPRLLGCQGESKFHYPARGYGLAVEEKKIMIEDIGLYRRLSGVFQGMYNHHFRLPPGQRNLLRIIIAAYRIGQPVPELDPAAGSLYIPSSRIQNGIVFERRISSRIRPGY